MVLSFQQRLTSLVFDGDMEEMDFPQMQYASKLPQEGDKGIFVPKAL
jgi:hypothetical protein